MIRTPLIEFNLANSFYAGLVVTAWTVNPTTLVKTTTKATLYTDTTGTGTTPNPVTLDGEGKWPRIVYVADSVILSIAGDGVATHETGIIPRLGYGRGNWLTATAYWPGDLAIGPNLSQYQCLLPHTSGVFATDLAALRWIITLNVSGIVGVPEAPSDSIPYSRRNALWAAAPTLAQMTAAEATIAALSGGVAFIGVLDAATDLVDYTAISGYTDGVLVAASAATNKYVIVVVAGIGLAPAPVVSLSVGDLLISTGSVWTRVAMNSATLSDAASDGLAYGRRDAAWVSVVRRNVRVVSGTADTPTAATDRDGFIACTSATAITITANDLGANVSYSVQQQGAGQVTIVAGAGVTPVSDKSAASYVTARRGAILTVICNGAGNVFVSGNTA